MNRAYSLLEIRSVNEDERVIEGMATTPTADRMDDIVEPLGAKFSLPMPLLWQHNASQPVGHVEFAEPTEKGIPFRARIVKVDEPGKLKDRVDEAWQSVKLQLVRAVSIGFRTLSYEIMKSGGYRYTAWEWLELSLVTIPANADATIQTIKSIDTQLRAASGNTATPVVRLEKPRATGVKAIPQTPKEGTNLNISEQIRSFTTTREAKSARMSEIMEKAAEEGVTLDSDATVEYDDLAAEIKSIDDHLVRLSALETTQIAKATPVIGVVDPASGSAVRTSAQVKARKPAEKGIEFAQFVMCLGAAKGSRSEALEIARSRSMSEDVVTSLKAAVAAGTTTDPTWAAPLVDSYQRFAGDFVEYLRPQTIIGRFGVDGIPSLRRVPFNISIAGQTSGGAGYWVGEGQPKPLTKFDFNEVNLRWAKVANIAVVTEELLRFSNPSAEALVRDQLAAALIARLDVDFIDPAKAAVANVSPASITNGVVAIPSTGNDAEAVRADVQAVFAAYILANMTPSSGVWLMSATRALALSQMRNALGQKEFPEISMLGGRFEGLPVIVSEYVPADRVILANASDIYLADDGQVVVDASREASLQMDTAPTNASAPSTPTTTVSMFQTNSVAIRAERWINWQKRRAQAVQVLSGVAWGTPVPSGG